MKIILSALKPRNPLVAPARMRQAGRHASPLDAARQRQHARQQLQRQLREPLPDEKL